MTYRLPKKKITEENLKKARQDGFMCGFITCLTDLTSGARDVDSVILSAWKSIGEPDAKTVAKLGISSTDRMTCTILRRHLREIRKAKNELA